MTTSTKRRITTAEELFNMPDDGYRYELVRGELRKMAPTGSEHGDISADIHISLGAYVRANNMGKTRIAESGFVLERDPDHVRAPDVAFVRRERVEAIGRQPGYWPEAPDLAIEVISPNDRYTEVNEKVADWLAAGTRMVVVVNPRNQTVRVHRAAADVVTLTITDTLDGGDVVPGWQMPLADIFAD
jgi:Uma2 family endonuclease